MNKIVLILVTAVSPLVNVSCAPEPTPIPPPVVVKIDSVRGSSSQSVPAAPSQPASNYKYLSYNSSGNYRTYSASPESFRAVTNQ